MTTIASCRPGRMVLIIGMALTMAVTIGLLTPTAWAKRVKFRSAPEPPSGLDIRLAEERGETIKPEPGILLNGRLTKPKGDGPFPAVVLLHGCNGLSPWYATWASRLKKWGYVTLRVDSFKPRGFTSVCEEQWKISVDIQRPYDASGALEYLRGLPYVDPDQIAIIGWSHGGSATLASVDRSRVQTLGLGDSQFRAAIAFYPGCDWHGFAGDFYAPVLVLIGEKDDWASAEACAAIKAQSPFGAEPIELKIYPGAYHGFDGSNPGSSYLGHWLQGDAKAARDARERVQAFLAKYLQ